MPKLTRLLVEGHKVSTWVVLGVACALASCNSGGGKADAGKRDGGPSSDAHPIVDAPAAERHADRSVDLGRDGPPEFTIVEFSVPTADSMPVGIAPGSDGNVWFTEKYGNNIGRVTPAGLVTEFPIPTAESEPNDCALGSDGNVWFTEFTGNNIGRITPAGAITEFPVPNVGQPNHIALGPDGNVWFTETVANRMVRVTPAGVITEFSVDAPINLTTGPGGDLWFTQIPVADSGGFGTTIVAKMTTTGTVTQFPSTVTNSDPGPITAGADGNLWFVEPLLFSIGRMPPTGGITEFRDVSQGISAFGITTGPDGNVWYSVGDMDCRLGRVTPSGQISEYPIPSPYAIVYEMCTGPDGNIWFAENGANKIGYIVP